MVPGFIGGRNETGMLKQASAATESAAAADSGERHSPHSDPSSAMPLPPSDGGTAAPVVRLPIVPLVRLMGAAAASLVVSWVVGFRGGLALNSDNNDLIFNVHPVLMVIGFILLYGEGATCLIMGTTADLIYLRSYNRNAIMMAILTYKTLSGTKNFKKAVHLTIQFLALCSGFIGVWAALKFHNGKGIDNFYSLHSWLGLTCLLLFGIQWGIGFATFWYPGGTRNGRAFLLPWHVFFGLYIYALAVITATTGLLEKATFLQSSSIILRYSNEAFLINFLGILIVALGGFVVFAVITPGSVKPDAYTGIQE